eukprot:COSAG02_NODE_2119_length_9782_cov_4.432511_5_plen_360_part_00
MSNRSPAFTPLDTPGSVPTTGNPRPRGTPVATPRPRPAPITLTEVSASIREILGQPITASDARQLGIPEESTDSTDVPPPGALMNLGSSPARSNTSLSTISNAGSDDSASDLLGVPYAVTLGITSGQRSSAKAGRHGDTSREYDDGFSRHAGAALNDAVIAGRSDDDASSVVSDQTGIDEFLAGIDDTDDSWLDAYYDAERRQLADGTLNIPDESLADLQQTAAAIDRAERIAAAAQDQAEDVPAAEAATDMSEARAAIALQLKQDKGLQKLIESKALKLDDILGDDGQPDLQKLNRLRDMIRDETSRASESYVKAATVQRAEPQPIEGYNPTVPGYRRVNGTKYFVWQPARYADSVPS